MSDNNTSSCLTREVADELTGLLMGGLIEEFMSQFRRTCKSVESDEEAPCTLADMINARIKETNPTCEVKIQVSQRTNDKRLVMIMDSSRFFGDGFTITRQMFSV